MSAIWGWNTSTHEIKKCGGLKKMWRATGWIEVWETANILGLGNEKSGNATLRRCCPCMYETPSTWSAAFRHLSSKAYHGVFLNTPWYALEPLHQSVLYIEYISYAPWCTWCDFPNCTIVYFTKHIMVQTGTGIPSTPRFRCIFKSRIVQRFRFVPWCVF